MACASASLVAAGAGQRWELADAGNVVAAAVVGGVALGLGANGCAAVAAGEGDVVGVAEAVVAACDEHEQQLVATGRRTDRLPARRL